MNADNKENFVPPPTPLLKKIGYGTGVSVYHLDRSPANHTVRSPWALKKVNRQHASLKHFQSRIENEAKILKELNHPNIVGFRGFTDTDDGRKVLAMEECTDSLGNLISQYAENRGPRFTSKEILTVVAAVAQALQYLHEEKRLLHADIKSHNILIKGIFAEVKLCDFGVSMSLDSSSVEDYVGSGPWSAPETLADGPLTEKADIFSLGLVMWEMLTLKTPNMADFDDSGLDSSNVVPLEDSVVWEEHFGETPALPENLSDEYALVRELYTLCTQQDYRQRPKARDILAKMKEAGFPLKAPPTEVIL